MSAGPAQRLRAELAIVTVAFIWGASFVTVKAALRDASPLVFLGLRFSLGVLLLLALFRLRPGALRDFPRHWRGGVLCGGLLFLGYALQTIGLETTAASKSAFLTGLYIVFTPLLGSLLRGAMPRAVEWMATALAFAGTGLLTLEPAAGLHLQRGDLLTVGAAALFALHMLSVERFSTVHNHESLTLWQVLGVAVFCLAGCGVVETPRLTWTPMLAGALVGTAALGTAVSFALYTWAQARTTATRAALMFSLEPVFAALTGLVWAGERWTGRTVGGASLILGAILLVEMKPFARESHPLN